MTRNKNFSKDLLRRIEDDGEYFTVKATGRSGMSQSGVARFTDKHPTTVGYWVDKVKNSDPEDNNLPEPLKLNIHWFYRADLLRACSIQLKGITDKCFKPFLPNKCKFITSTVSKTLHFCRR